MNRCVDQINIIADDREGKSRIIAKLQAMEDVSVCFMRLGIGDYKVDNRPKQRPV